MIHNVGKEVSGEIVEASLRGEAFRLNYEESTKLKENFQDDKVLSVFVALILLGSQTIDLHIRVYQSTLSHSKSDDSHSHNVKSEHSKQSVESEMKNDPFVRNIEQVCFLQSGKRLIKEGMNATQKVLAVIEYIKSLEEAKNSEGTCTNVLSAVAAFPARKLKIPKKNIVNAISYLVHCGYDINRKDALDITPLHHAAGSNNALVVEELLKYPSIVLDGKNKAGSTPLNAAIIGYNLYQGIESVQLLAEAESERSNKDVLAAVQKGFINSTILRVVTINLTAKYIVSKFVYKHNGVSLYSAIKKNNIEVVKELLRHPYLDPNMVQDLYTPLGLAIGGDHVEIAEMLLAHPKLDPCIPCSVDNVGKSKSNETNLEYAVYNRAPRIVQALLKHPKVIAREMKSVGRALIRVVDRGMYSNKDKEKTIGVVKALIECPKVQISQAEYFKAFRKVYFHSITEYQEITKILIRNPKFDINISDGYGKTPLHMALERPHALTLCTELLKREDIDLSIKDNEGRTPLRLAIERGIVDTIQILLEFQSRRCNTDIRALLKAELSEQITVERVGWFGSKEIKLTAIDETPEQIIAKFKYNDSEINAMLVQITKTGAHSISK